MKTAEHEHVQIAGLEVFTANRKIRLTREESTNPGLVRELIPAGDLGIYPLEVVSRDEWIQGRRQLLAQEMATRG